MKSLHIDFKFISFSLAYWFQLSQKRKVRKFQTLQRIKSQRQQQTQHSVCKSKLVGVFTLTKEIFSPAFKSNKISRSVNLRTAWAQSRKIYNSYFTKSQLAFNVSLQLALNFSITVKNHWRKPFMQSNYLILKSKARSKNLRINMHFQIIPILSKDKKAISFNNLSEFLAKKFWHKS